MSKYHGVIEHPYGMDYIQARAIVESYNEHVDATDRCAEWAYTSDSAFDQRVYGRLAEEYMDMSGQELCTLLHYGWDYVTVDDWGHIALKNEQMALAV